MRPLVVHALCAAALTFAPTGGSTGSDGNASIINKRIQVFQPADTERIGKVRRTYFYSATATEESMVAFRRNLIRAGARAVNLFLPDNVVVCELPRSRDLSGVIAAAGVSVMDESVVANRASAQARAMNWIRSAYQISDRESGPGPVHGEDQGGQSFSDEVVLTPERVGRIQAEVYRMRPDLKRSADGMAQTIPNVWQNSELMRRLCAYS